MCAIVVKRGEETVAEEVVEFYYEEGTLRLRRLFSEEIVLQNVRRFEWREKDDTLRILE